MLNSDTLAGLVHGTKRARQIAAAIVRQALLNIERNEPLKPHNVQKLWADRQALETALAALTAPTPPKDERSPKHGDLKTLSEELDLHD